VIVYYNLYRLSRKDYEMLPPIMPLALNTITTAVPDDAARVTDVTLVPPASPLERFTAVQPEFVVLAAILMIFVAAFVFLKYILTILPEVKLLILIVLAVPLALWVYAKIENAPASKIVSKSVELLLLPKALLVNV
jgi:hypothetical protein